jgi:hypothetical protein
MHGIPGLHVNPPCPRDDIPPNTATPRRAPTIFFSLDPEQSWCLVRAAPDGAERRPWAMSDGVTVVWPCMSVNLTCLRHSSCAGSWFVVYSPRRIKAIERRLGASKAKQSKARGTMSPPKILVPPASRRDDVSRRHCWRAGSVHVRAVVSWGGRQHGRRAGWNGTRVRRGALSLAKASGTRLINGWSGAAAGRGSTAFGACGDVYLAAST